MPTCSHPQSETRLRTLSNQTTALYPQCTTCGQVTGQAVSKTKFTSEQLEALPRYDDQLQDSWWAANHQYSEQERIEAERKRQETLKQRKEEYAAYLLSPAWRVKRKAVLERDNYLCQGCRCAPATEVHHLTYLHIFDELLFELTSVCSECHDRAHPEKRQ